MSAAPSSRVEEVERALRSALQQARDAGVDLIYGGAPIEYSKDGATVGISLLNTLLPAGSRLGSFSDLACAVAAGLGVSECVAREISYGWECAPPDTILPDWNALGWRLHCEFQPRSAENA